MSLSMEIWLRSPRDISCQLGSHKYRSSCPKSFVKKVFLKVSPSWQENICAGVFFSKVGGQDCNIIKRKTPAQVFSCDFCKIFKNIYFVEHLWAAACALVPYVAWVPSWSRSHWIWLQIKSAVCASFDFT